MSEPIKGFKGFDKNLKCQDFKFEIGKEFKHSGEVKLCKTGFHFCEHPLDVFGYYPPNESRFAEVEAQQVSPEKDSDTKRVSAVISIKTELSFSAMITAAVKFVFDRAKWTEEKTTSKDREGVSATGYSGAASATGDSGAASATGYSGAASATGDRGAASATGDRGAASATGEQGVAFSVGIEAKGKAAKGAWITLAEWKFQENAWHRIDVQTKRVDGKKIKADKFYTLKKGKFVLAD